MYHTSVKNSVPLPPSYSFSNIPLNLSLDFYIYLSISHHSLSPEKQYFLFSQLEYDDII